jgi:hypothetical protein
MPDERLIHRTVGHSLKFNKLTDFERLVWLMYKLAADDFGVMKFSAITIQESADWLAMKPTKAVQRSLERIREVGLVQTFTHQDRLYCYQWDWQTWQKITHPRKTKQPLPDTEFSRDRNTQWLFDHHPDGGKLSSWQHPDLRPKKAVSAPGENRESAGNAPVLFPSQSRPVFVGSG